ncbi:MAG: ABC transporter permease [Bryobacterales bacterium]
MRQALRTLARDKAFTAFSIGMLALGIGSVTAIFSIVNAVVLRSLFPRPERLFAIDEVVPKLAAQYPAEAFPVNGRHFDEWRASCTVCESIGLASAQGGGGNLTGDGPPERISLLRVSHDLLPTLGVSPALGRDFLPSDDEQGAPPVLLLTDAFWRRRFQADPSIVGQDIRLDGQPRTVIGVLPPSFALKGGDYLHEFRTLDRPYDALVPLRLRYGAIRSYGNFNFGAVVRLEPGATPAQAAEQMNVALRPFVEEFDSEMSVRLRQLDEAVLGSTSKALWMFLAAVSGVLLIVCVNLGNLMLARAERRTREAAVRRALGATTAHLLCQALRETVILTLLGAVAGLLCAYWAVEAALGLAPPDTPRLADVHIDAQALAFAIGIAALAGLFTGIIPALRFSRGRLASGLRDSHATSTVSSHRARSVLVSVEVALSAALLVIAGLAGTAFFRLMSVERGFVTENVLAFDLTLPRQDYPYPQGGRFHEALLPRLQGLPGVRSVGLTTKIPLEGSTSVDGVVREDSTQRKEERIQAEYRFVSADYFSAMGVPLITGRLLTPQDRERPAAVISESVARQVWPGESPLGKRFLTGSADDRPKEVVGVVGDVRTTGLDKDSMPIAYLSYWQRPLDSVSYAVRTAGDPLLLTASIREAVQAVDPAMPVVNVRTMAQVVDESTASQRFQSLLAAAFAATALLLATLGVYGVVSYAVARRTNEIGLRMALGARAFGVLGMILRQGMQPVLFGLAAGLAAALAAGRLLESLLFEISPRDPLVFAAVALLLLAAGTLACYFPARRAARIDPMTALRNE